jgi:hypothetical protein
LTLRRICEKTWEYDQKVYVAFMDLEKAYDRVPRGLLWRVPQEYRVGGELLRAIISLYRDGRSCARVSGKKSDLFDARVRLHKGCVLSPPVCGLNGQTKQAQLWSGVCPIGGPWGAESALCGRRSTLGLYGTDLQRVLHRFATEC